MTPQEKHLRELAAARSRVNHLQMTLDTHRSVTASRAGFWLQIDTEYAAALANAKQELERLEAISN